jgi:signal transduction histidine kinase
MFTKKADFTIILLVQNIEYCLRLQPTMDNSKPKQAKVNGSSKCRKTEAEHAKLKHDYEERIKELNCLYGFSKLVETTKFSLEEILQRTNDLLPAAWQYPEITCSRIILGKKKYTTKNFKQSKWKQQSLIRAQGKKTGLVEIYYLEEKPTIAEGPFLIEEQNLLDAIAERLGQIIERKRAETSLNKSEKKNLTLLAEMKRRQSDVSALLKASGAVLRNREFKVSARAVFDACKDIIGATAGYVALLSDDGKDNIVLFLEAGGQQCTVDPSLPMPIRGLRAQTYLTGKAAIENNFPKCQYKKFLPGGHVNLKNVLFAPLVVDSKTVGTIGLANKPEGFSDHDAQMAIAFGEIASMALINSNMLEMLEENEKRLKVYSEDLERLVDERTRQLKESERFVAIGQTAGMVGHDIRNPLQGILSDVYLVKSDLSLMQDSSEKNNIQESLTEMEKNIEYINKIVADLQDFARPLRPIVQDMDLDSVIDEVLLKSPIPENIEISSQVNEGAKRIVADPVLLTRVLTNLITNAVQAMPEGGKLSVNAYRERENVVVSVEDTGAGIPEEVKPKLFTPLFTTKSKGQGFGLAAVKRLIESLGGSVRFESEKGKGTKFILSLPQGCAN